MISPPFQSYSQNGEDVVLWRALRGVPRGRYIEVGANHPVRDSITMAFYAVGWRGITIEPDPEFAALQRRCRPGDLVVEAAITRNDHDRAILHVVDGTGLSTLDDAIAATYAGSNHESHDTPITTRRLDSVLEEAGWAGRDIHFMSVDTEGSERQVLESLDLKLWRPWVLVIEATAPTTTESTRHLWEDLVTAAGYQFCLFDGLSCFYVADEHGQQFSPALSYPACPFDNYTPREFRECRERVDAVQALAERRAEESRGLLEDVVRWRAEALTRWATAIDNTTGMEEWRAVQQERNQMSEQADALYRRVAELEASTSWRVTKPLRSASGVVSRMRHRR